VCRGRCMLVFMHLAFGLSCELRGGKKKTTLVSCISMLVYMHFALELDLELLELELWG